MAKTKRQEVVREVMSALQEVMSGPRSVDQINKAKELLVGLANQKDLFPYEDFPIPAGEGEATYLIYLNEDGTHPLYVYVTYEGGQYHPHDHGDAWAIVAAVDGPEKHCLYQRVDPGNSAGEAKLELAAEIVVEPGVGVSMIEGGIHHIEDVEKQGFMHLHCYSKTFDTQRGRLEYDLKAGKAFYNNDFEFDIIEQL